MASSPRDNLLAGMDPGTFLQIHWQKKPLLIRQAIPGFVSPIDGDELAGLACEEGVEARLIERRGGRWSLRQGPFGERDFSRLPARDWTLLVQDVDKHLPDFAEYLDLFDFIPSWRVDDLMISVAAEGGGVGPHTDAYDVFLLQAAGRRQWSIAGNYDPAIIEGLDVRVLRHFEAEQSFVLEPGDMLYLPPNVAHDGIALDDGCQTWSIGFRAPSVREMFTDFSEWLYQRLAESAMYTDADLAPDEASGGRIDARAVARARALLEQALQSGDGDLERWFGCFMTEPKPWLECEPADEPLTADDLRALFANGKALLRDSRARLAWTGMNGRCLLFVNGECRELPVSMAGTLEKLCTLRRLDRDALANALDEPGIALLLDLHAAGVLHVEDDDDEQ